MKKLFEVPEWKLVDLDYDVLTTSILEPEPTTPPLCPNAMEEIEG